MPGDPKYRNESRDERIKRVRESVTERAKRDGFDDRRARQIAERAVEKADHAKRERGDW